jgi:hypothetical protein
VRHLRPKNKTVDMTRNNDITEVATATEQRCQRGWSPAGALPIRDVNAITAAPRAAIPRNP